MKSFALLMLLLASTVAAADTTTALKLDKTITMSIADEQTTDTFRFYVSKSYIYRVTIRAMDIAVGLDDGKVVGDADPAHNIPEPPCKTELLPQVAYDEYGDPIPQLSTLVMLTCASYSPMKYLPLTKGWYTLTVNGYGPGRYTVNVRAVEDSQQ